MSLRPYVLGSAAWLRRAAQGPFTLALIVGAVTLTGGDARAQKNRSAATQPAPDPTAERVRTLKATGDEAMETLRYADALKAYTEAYGLSPTPVLAFNRARALQALGEYPAALELFERFDEEAPPDVKARVPGLPALLADMRQRVSTLVITCNVEGAQIRVRDRSVGKCPPKGPIKVVAGPAVVDVTADGYFPFHRELDLPGRGVATIEVQMGSKQNNGILAIASPVTGADVSVDQRPAGKVPLEMFVPAGTHEIALHHEGYEPVKTSAVVRAGEEKHVSVPMEALPPITSKWWFWTGIAVVVAGGAVLTYALLTEKPADHGTIAPGQAPAPAAFRF